MAPVTEQQRHRTNAGWSIRRAGKGKDVARATHASVSIISRRSNGFIGSPESIALAHACKLARGIKTSPFPFLVAMQTEAIRTYCESKTTEWLIGRFHELRDRMEPEAEALEEIASRGECRKRYREALKVEAEIQMELSAVDEELERRGTDPRNYRGNGHRIIR